MFFLWQGAPTHRFVALCQKDGGYPAILLQQVREEFFYEEEPTEKEVGPEAKKVKYYGVCGGDSLGTRNHSAGPC